jgi:1-acyl-sn-glycerol-3-phosphate acyltransferase
VGTPVSGLPARIADWRPRTPPLPDHLATLVRDGDPDWFARHLAIAAAPPWWFWRFALERFSWLVGLFGRIEVTGSIPEELRGGPLLLAANRIGDFDPFVVAVALHRLGVTPRMLATGGIFDASVAGPLLERTGGIRVDRGTELARHAVRVTEVALVHGGHVLAYPEGRVGLTRDGWPERGRTGNDRTKLRTAVRALVRRPALRVHVGPPVDFSDLRPGRVGDANRARYRITAAITRGLVPLRAGELDAPRFVDPTRPTTAVAAYPGGVVPEAIP